jgi:uncharacterized membrane protein
MYKNNKLRIAWIIPHVILVVLDFFLVTFIILNFYELKYDGVLGIYTGMFILLTLVLSVGSYTIINWIKEKKM